MKFKLVTWNGRLSERELATLLATLRRWQQDMEANADGFVDIDHFDECIMPLEYQEATSELFPYAPCITSRSAVSFR